MKIFYKTIIHKKEGEDDWIRFNMWNGNVLNAIYCCEKLKNFEGQGFTEIKHDNRDKVNLKYDERMKPATKPEYCLRTAESGGCGDDFEEVYYPITNCFFCGAKIELIETEITEIKHTYETKKVMKEVVESVPIEEKKTVWKLNE